MKTNDRYNHMTNSKRIFRLKKTIKEMTEQKFNLKIIKKYQDQLNKLEKKEG